MLDELVCSLSGMAPTDEEIIQSDSTNDEDLPLGWIKVTIERKYPNPLWWKLQNVKSSLHKATLDQIPEEHREEQSDNITIQVDAQYLALEQTEKYNKVVIEKEVVFIAPPERDEDLMQEYLQLLDTLGIDVETGDEEDDSEEDLPLEDSEVIESPIPEEKEIATAS